jgi:hypothetical protein
MINNSIKLIDSNGNEFWKNEINQFHRLDGPAYIKKDGSQYWYVNGKYHRLDGPAYIGRDGSQYWYINDNNITKEVIKWMKCNNISYPFNEETQALFKLRFL